MQRFQAFSPAPCWCSLLAAIFCVSMGTAQPMAVTWDASSTTIATDATLGLCFNNTPARHTRRCGYFACGLGPGQPDPPWPPLRDHHGLDRQRAATILSYRIDHQAHAVARRLAPLRRLERGSQRRPLSLDRPGRDMESSDSGHNGQQQRSQSDRADPSQRHPGCGPCVGHTIDREGPGMRLARYNVGGLRFHNPGCARPPPQVPPAIRVSPATAARSIRSGEDTRSGNDQLYLTQSTDFGVTWTAEQAVRSSPGGTILSGGDPSLVALPGGYVLSWIPADQHRLPSHVDLPDRRLQRPWSPRFRVVCPHRRLGIRGDRNGVGAIHRQSFRR
jgi:hypothetical protein